MLITDTILCIFSVATFPKDPPALETLAVTRTLPQSLTFTVVYHLGFSMNLFFPWFGK